MSQLTFGMKSTFWLLLGIFAASLPAVCKSANILGFFPTPSKSHLIIHSAIASALADRGHNVTVLSTMPPVEKNFKYNYVQVDVPRFSDDFLTKMVNKPMPAYRQFWTVLSIMIDLGNATLSHPTTKKIMAEESFDLVILAYFVNDFQLGVAAHFKCPVVVSFVIQPIPIVHEMVGNPLEISYVPNLFSGLTQPMGFFDRVKNFLYSVCVEELIMRPMWLYKMNRAYVTHFPDDQYPSLDHMRRNVSLVLSNHHFSQSPVRPNVPAMIEIGGIQIKENQNPLPENIASVLDNVGDDGVIYFSFGSVVQESTLSKDKTKIMFDVLSKLPQKVLWKWGNSEFPGQSRNIHFYSWLPQGDVLRHPSVKLFITHGGTGSIVESQYHGVPMLGIPFFGDHHANMAKVVRLGFGLQLDYLTLTEERFRGAIEELLRNSRYTETVRRFSNIYNDRPMSARNTAVYWIEYVLRHKGAPHMQSPAVQMNNLQLMSLDVVAFLLLVAYVALKLTAVLCRFVFGRILRKGLPAKRSKKSPTHNKSE